MSDRPRLTRQQQAVLTFIVWHVAERGYPPTVREIGEELGMYSTSTVAYHLRTLVSKGYLVCEPGRSRAIRVVA